jgi:hypothetical protein
MQSTQKPALNEYPCRYGFFQLYTNLAGLIIIVPIFDKIRMDESFSTPVHIIIQGSGYFFQGKMIALAPLKGIWLLPQGKANVGVGSC